jgi:hypothetical protein
MKALFLSLFFALSASAAGPDYIGRVVKVVGSVEKVNAKGEVVKLGTGDKLLVGDEIKASDRSMAKILMKDETLFTVGPQTHFVIEEFEARTLEDRTASYNLLKGKLRSVFSVKAPERTLTIKTPSASMGIRGTEIVSDVYKIGDEMKTDIALLSGSLEINSRDIDNNAKTLMMTPGQIFEAGMAANGANAPKPLRKMEQVLLERLRLGERKGGNVFLFDAMKSFRPAPAARFDFKTSSKAAPVEIKDKGEGALEIKQDRVSSLKNEKIKMMEPRKEIKNDQKTVTDRDPASVIVPPAAVKEQVEIIRNDIDTKPVVNIKPDISPVVVDRLKDSVLGGAGVTVPMNGGDRTGGALSGAVVNTATSSNLSAEQQKKLEQEAERMKQLLMEKLAQEQAAVQAEAERKAAEIVRKLASEAELDAQKVLELCRQYPEKCANAAQ